MTTVYRDGAWKIVIYANDHAPPHFHIRFSDGEHCAVTISGLELLAGSDMHRSIGMPLIGPNLINVNWKPSGGS